MKIVKMLLVAEIVVEDNEGGAEAVQHLDGFREATLPSSEFAITLYRATEDDLLRIPPYPNVVIEQEVS